MKQAVNQYAFEQAFRDCGRFGGDHDNFSYEALELLFEWFEQYEDDCGTEIDLDPIAICCDFTEASRAEIISYYDCADRLLLLESPQEDPEDIPDEAVADWLMARTSYVGKAEHRATQNILANSRRVALEEPTFVFQSF